MHSCTITAGVLAALAALTVSTAGCKSPYTTREETAPVAEKSIAEVPRESPDRVEDAQRKGATGHDDVDERGAQRTETPDDRPRAQQPLATRGVERPRRPSEARPVQPPAGPANQAAPDARRREDGQLSDRPSDAPPRISPSLGAGARTSSTIGTNGELYSVGDDAIVLSFGGSSLRVTVDPDRAIIRLDERPSALVSLPVGAEVTVSYRMRNGLAVAERIEARTDSAETAADTTGTGATGDTGGATPPGTDGRGGSTTGTTGGSGPVITGTPGTTGTGTTGTGPGTTGTGTGAGPSGTGAGAGTTRPGTTSDGAGPSGGGGTGGAGTVTGTTGGGVGGGGGAQ